MEWVRRILISVAMLVLVGVGSVVLYNVAYSEGEKLGYENGYSVGHEAGYSSGKQDGYDEGYVSGEQDGYAEGYVSGKQVGYAEGETAGYLSGKQDGYGEGEDVGYEAGYAEGIEAGLGHGYTLKDPTYAEAVAFLKEDKTDKNEYIEDTYGVYVCSHFARDVCNNAAEAGLRSAFVELRYLDGGHAIIAFYTIDKGLVYFEPETDERAKPVVGKRYYQCLEPRPGYYYEEPSFDDTIMDIVIIW